MSDEDDPIYISISDEEISFKEPAEISGHELTEVERTWIGCPPDEGDSPARPRDVELTSEGILTGQKLLEFCTQSSNACTSSLQEKSVEKTATRSRRLSSRSLSKTEIQKNMPSEPKRQQKAKRSKGPPVSVDIKAINQNELNIDVTNLSNTSFSDSKEDGPSDDEKCMKSGQNKETQMVSTESEVKQATQKNKRKTRNRQSPSILSPRRTPRKRKAQEISDMHPTNSGDVMESIINVADIKIEKDSDILGDTEPETQQEKLLDNVSHTPTCEITPKSLKPARGRNRAKRTIIDAKETDQQNCPLQNTLQNIEHSDVQSRPFGKEKFCDNKLESETQQEKTFDNVSDTSTCEITPKSQTLKPARGRNRAKQTVIEAKVTDQHNCPLQNREQGTQIADSAKKSTSEDLPESAPKQSANDSVQPIITQIKTEPLSESSFSSEDELSLNQLKLQSEGAEPNKQKGGNKSPKSKISRKRKTPKSQGRPKQNKKTRLEVQSPRNLKPGPKASKSLIATSEVFTTPKPKPPKTQTKNVRKSFKSKEIIESTSSSEDESSPIAREVLDENKTEDLHLDKRLESDNSPNFHQPVPQGAKGMIEHKVPETKHAETMEGNLVNVFPKPTLMLPTILPTPVPAVEKTTELHAKSVEEVTEDDSIIVPMVTESEDKNIDNCNVNCSDEGSETEPLQDQEIVCANTLSLDISPCPVPLKTDQKSAPICGTLSSKLKYKPGPLSSKKNVAQSTENLSVQGKSDKELISLNIELDKQCPKILLTRLQQTSYSAVKINQPCSALLTATEKINSLQVEISTQPDNSEDHISDACTPERIVDKVDSKIQSEAISTTTNEMQRVDNPGKYSPLTFPVWCQTDNGYVSICNTANDADIPDLERPESEKLKNLTKEGSSERNRKDRKNKKEKTGKSAHSDSHSKKEKTGKSDHRSHSHKEKPGKHHSHSYSQKEKPGKADTGSNSQSQKPGKSDTDNQTKKEKTGKYDHHSKSHSQKEKSGKADTGSNSQSQKPGKSDHSENQSRKEKTGIDSHSQKEKTGKTDTSSNSQSQKPGKSDHSENQSKKEKTGIDGHSQKEKHGKTDTSSNSQSQKPGKSYHSENQSKKEKTGIDSHSQKEKTGNSERFRVKSSTKSTSDHSKVHLQQKKEVKPKKKKVPTATLR